MRRPIARTTAALATAALTFASGACGPDEPPATSPVETDQPVVVDPGEQQGETLLPETPAEAEPGAGG